MNIIIKPNECNLQFSKFNEELYRSNHDRETNQGLKFNGKSRFEYGYGYVSAFEGKSKAGKGSCQRNKP